MYSTEHKFRLVPFQALIGLSVLFFLLGFFHAGFFWPLLLTLPLVALGVYDLKQPHHSLLRNYPIIGHGRYLLESIGPPMHQYFVETNKSGAPFNRDQRSMVYQRSKDVTSKKPFGTELNVYQSDYIWLSHSMAPKAKAEELPRITIGGADCRQPYSASILNISGMSYGALSSNAIMALNKGAKMGNFFHNTGEGSISRYHREYGGDLCWQFGSSYFGCRQKDGNFDPGLFAEQAKGGQVKMIEIKLSQGAKPGHGGILPAEKITPEIAEARKIPMGEDCISPPYHTAFATPIELLEFVGQLRELSGGKPIGFKLCVGQPWEFLGVCKAMLETGILPDFIAIDGGEGGTGAAPLEFSDHIGMPMREGVAFVHNALIGIGVRDQIKLGASGKIASAGLIAAAMAFGADWVNAARPFMFTIGCIQAQTCHSNVCPVGVATQDPKLTKALDVTDKSRRVCNFHRNTLETLNEIVAATGLDHPKQLGLRHICQRVGPTEIKTYDEIYPGLQSGELLGETSRPIFKKYWALARADSFQSY